MTLNSVNKIKNFSGKKVFLRVDFNVPIKNNKIIDDFKIKASLPTVRFLLEKGAQLIIVTHLGRPQKTEVGLSTKILGNYLGKILGERVHFIPFTKNFFDLSVADIDARIVMLENVRFYKEEENNDRRFSKHLASLAELYVLDGFAVAHREAASVTGIAEFLPSFAGLLLTEEIKQLSNLEFSKKPYVAVLGGAKVETKIPILKNILKKADYILVGGGIANTWEAAKGKRIGSSLFGSDYLKEILNYCGKKKVILPVDYVVGDLLGKKAYTIAAKDLNLSKEERIYDIGPATVALYADFIKKAETLVWNGAMGKFEIPVYAYGTKSLACLMAAKSKGRAFGVVGGGETVEVIENLGLRENFDWVSTGGGAMLDFLSGKKLPGLKFLIKK